jgi:hypothetical protein
VLLERYWQISADGSPPSWIKRLASASVAADMAAMAAASNVDPSGSREPSTNPSALAITAPVTPGTPSTTLSTRFPIVASSSDITALSSASPPGT